MSLKYEDNIGLVHLLAGKVYQRLMAVNINFDYDDLFQELSIIFLKSVASFDETKGYQFSSYFTKAAYSHASAIVKKNQITVQMDSLDNEHSTLQLASEDSTQEETMMASEAFEKAFDELSTTGKLVMHMALNESEQIKEEVEKTSNKKGRRVSKLKITFMLYSKLSSMTATDSRALWDELAPFDEVVA